MPVERTRVVGPVMLPDGSAAPDGAKIVFTLKDWDRQAGALIMHGQTEAVVIGGAIDKSLKRSSGERGSLYEVSYHYWNEATLKWAKLDLGQIALVGPGPVVLADLLALPAPIPNVPDVLTQALGAKAGADAAAGISEENAAVAIDKAAQASADALIAAQQRALSEAAAQAALNGNWSYVVVDNAALLALSGVTANQTAFVRLTEHNWRFEGGGWVDKGKSVIAEKAPKSQTIILKEDEIDDLVQFEDRMGIALPFGFNSDGQLNDLTVAGMLARLEEQTALPKYQEVEEVALLFEDRGGTFMWGVVRDSDGEWPDWAVAGMARRFGEQGLFPNGDPANWNEAEADAAFDNIQPKVAAEANPAAWSEDEAASAALKVTPYLGDAGGGGAATVDWLQGRGTAGTYSGDADPPKYHLKSGKWREVDTDLREAVTMGSSTLANMGTQLASMFAGLTTHKGEAVTFTPLAKGGERSDHACARTGVIPALVSIPSEAIPASGPVNATVSNLFLTSSMLPYVGTLAGVPGTLTCSGGSFVFTRSKAGVSAPVMGQVPFYPSVGPEKLNKFWIINVGKNDITSSVPVEETIARTDAIAQALFAQNKRFVIFDHFVNRDVAAVHSQRSKVETVNAHLKDRYGPLLVSIRDFLLHPEFWTWYAEDNPGFAGPTAADLAQWALGNLTPSQGMDSGHMSAAVNLMFTQRILKPRLIALGFYKE